MSKKRNLLEYKKNLIAFALAGACAVGLVGCTGESNSADKKSDIDAETLESEGKAYYIQLFEDRAVVIVGDYETPSGINVQGYYNVCRNEKTKWSSKLLGGMRLPIESTCVLYANAGITPEEYIAAAKGPDFPITYLSILDVTLEEEGPKLTK